MQIQQSPSSQHYGSYMANLSMRKLHDERGNIYWGIDGDIRDRTYTVHSGFYS